MLNKIAVATTTRAEYGIVSPFIRRVFEDPDSELILLVSGTHLSGEHGHTVDEIKKDGFPISKEIDIMEKGDSPFDISKMMANSIVGFAKALAENRPDILVISGDRTEMLGVACAALNEKIPLAHYSGGEVTEGAIDDCIRHSLTKMSYLHFTSTELYRERVISLGEAPERVFNVGALGVENIANISFIPEEEIRADIGIPEKTEYAVVTFHPVTLEDTPAAGQARSRRATRVSQPSPTSVSAPLASNTA